MGRVVGSQRDLFTRRWRNVIHDIRLESAFHIQLVSILRWAIKPTVIWRHVPNGEHRDPRTAAKLKAMGILPGSADLEFHWVESGWLCEKPGQLHGKMRRVLHLELKIGNRKPSESQAAFALAMKLLGDDYEVAHSIDEAIKIVGKHGLIRPNVEVCGKRW